MLRDFHQSSTWSRPQHPTRRHTVRKKAQKNHTDNTIQKNFLVDKKQKNTTEVNFVLMRLLRKNLLSCYSFNFPPLKCEPPQYLHKSFRKGKGHCWSQVCRRSCHCNWSTRLHGMVWSQHLNLWVRPNHHWFLLLFTRLERATRANMVSRSNFWFSIRFITC